MSTAVNTFVIIPEIMPQDQAVMKQSDKRRESSRLKIKPSKFREGFLFSTTTKCRGDKKSVADDVSSSFEIVLPLDLHARATPANNSKALISRSSGSESSLERPSVSVLPSKLQIACKSATARATEFWGDAAKSYSSVKAGSDDNGLKAAYAVLKRVMLIKSAEPFNEPVDSVALEIPDYLDVIKQPMDLGTIQELLESGKKYKTAQDVYEDVQLVWRNCRDYNQKGDPIMDILKVVENVFNKHWNAAGLQSFTSGAKFQKLEKQEETSNVVLSNEVVPVQEQQEGEETHWKRRKDSKVVSKLKTRKPVSTFEMVPVQEQNEGEETWRRKREDSKVVPKLKIVHFDDSSLRIKTKQNASVEHVMAENQAKEVELDWEDIKVTGLNSNYSQEHEGDLVMAEQEPCTVPNRGLNTAKESQTNGAGRQTVAQASKIMTDSDTKQTKRAKDVFESEARTPLQDKEKTLRGYPSNKRRTFGTVHHKPECPCVVCVGRRRKLARQEREGVQGKDYRKDNRKSKSKSHSSLILQSQINKTKLSKVAKSLKQSQRLEDTTSKATSVDTEVDDMRCYPANYDLPLRKVNPSLVHFSQILFASHPTLWRKYNSLGCRVSPAVLTSAMFEAVCCLDMNEKKPLSSSMMD